MCLTQYSLPVLEEEQELECQDNGLPHLVLTTDPFDDDGCDEDRQIQAEAEED